MGVQLADVVVCPEQTASCHDAVSVNNISVNTTDANRDDNQNVFSVGGSAIARNYSNW